MTPQERQQFIEGIQDGEAEVLRTLLSLSCQLIADILMSKRTDAESLAYVAQREQALGMSIDAAAERFRETMPARVAEWKERVAHFKQMDAASAR
jgi:hypothetical protein